MSQKFEFYQKLTLLIKKKKIIIFFLVRPNNMGIYCAHFNFSKKGAKKNHSNANVTNTKIIHLNKYDLKGQ